MSVIQTIIDNAILEARNNAAIAQTYGGVAIAAATGSAAYTPAKVAELSVNEPNVFVPTRAAGVDSDEFQSYYQTIITDLANRFRAFTDEYLSIDPELMPETEAWLKRAIADGGTGVNATVEDRIWQRDRDRINTEAASASDAVFSDVAARGFPVPAGALNAGLAAVQRKKSAEIAAVSRDTAINAFKTEIENIRFAIGMAIDYRMRALSAAGDYIKALATAPDIAARLSTQAADAQARLISAVSGLFNARINAKELVLKAQLANQDVQFKSADMIIDNSTAFADMRVKAVLAVCEAISRQAAAYANGINGTAQLIEAAD